MKKVLKTPGPNVLTQYALSNPNDTWERFRDDQAGQSYQTIRDLLRDDQGGLCAYCETKPNIEREQVEHFVPKSTPGPHNHGLDWSNLLMVCDGGSRGKDPLPANLRCDQHRNHYEQTKTSKQILDPQALLAFPPRFRFDRSDFTIQPADPDDTLAIQTIEVLNLNCPRLVKDREQILHEYNRELKRARLRNDRAFLKDLATRWFTTRWRSYFTTRRLILGEHAEDFLRSRSYDG